MHTIDTTRTPLTSDINASQTGRSESGQYAGQSAKSQIQTELRQALRIDLGERLFSEIEAVLDHIDGQGDSDFGTLSNCAKNLIDQFQNQPPVINKVLHYINAQSMLINAGQTNLHAEINTVNSTLNSSVNAFIQKFTTNTEGPTNPFKGIVVSPVFTAHPTNLAKPEAAELAYGMTVKTNAAEAAGGSTTEPQAKRQKTGVSNANPSDQVKQLWLHQGRREVAPTVSQEAEVYQKVFRNVLKASHQLNKKINQAVQLQTSLALDEPLIKAGNWVGGDRDGNCFVTAKTLKASVAQYASTALSRYARTLGDEKISSSVEPEKFNLRTLASAAQQNGAIAIIQSKLEATRTRYESLISTDGGPQPKSTEAGYRNSAELIADLQGLDFSTLPEQLRDRAQFKVQNLILDIKANGLHGVSTDIRQNSAINEKTVDILLKLSGVRNDYRQLSEPAKQQVLLDILNSPDSLVLENDLSALPASQREKILKDYSPQEIDDFNQETEIIRAYKEIHTEFGPGALENCITANTESVSDLMEVMVLLKHAGVAGRDFCNMQVVGLFETVDDLKNGPGILNELLSIPWYKEALSQSGNVQTVMLGYSDSGRLAGSLASNAAVYRCTREMMKVAEQHGVQLKFFHGRGGSESRGAGLDYKDEIAVHDGNSLRQGILQTEQGEEVNTKFGNLPIAYANLDQMVSATLERIVAGGDEHQVAQFMGIVQELAQHAEQSYKSLYQHPDLSQFYESTTPISFVKHTNAGSRPPKRADPNAPPKALNINELRAIPWVGCWMQIRATVPGFYGTGTALENFLNSGSSEQTSQAKLESLRDMYQSWPFFKNLVDRTEMVLAKCDMDIAKQYADHSPENRNLLGLIQDEYQKTTTYINAIKNQAQLMQHRPTEKIELEARKGLLNWSNAIQADLIKRCRQGGAQATQHWTESVVVSMQAVANGLGRFG